MSFEIALSGLERYRLRTALSLFGLAIGNGARTSSQDQIRAAGLNVIVVKAGNYKTKGDEIIEVQAPHARLTPLLDRLLSALVPHLLAHPENDPMEKHDHPAAARGWETPRRVWERRRR